MTALGIVLALGALGVIALLISAARAALVDRRRTEDREQERLIRQLHEIQARRKSNGSRER